MELESRRQTRESEKKEMQKKAVTVLSVTEVWWKGKAENRSSYYTVYYSGVKGLTEAYINSGA
jgi:hypothetical protein